MVQISIFSIFPDPAKHVGSGGQSTQFSYSSQITDPGGQMLHQQR